MSEPTGARRYGTGGGDAYYDAVKYGGYEGTREQFGKDQAEFAKNATAVAEAKETVEKDIEDIQSAISTFTDTTVPEAIQSVQDEGDTQVDAVTQKGEEVSQQVETVGTEQKDAVANEGRSRIQAIEQAGTDQVQTVNDAGTTQVGNVNQAGEDQVDAVEQAGADQAQAVEDKGEEVLNSIPADYIELTEEVNNLKTATTQLGEVSALDSNVAISFEDEERGFIRYDTGAVIGTDTFRATNYIDISAFATITYKRVNDTASSSTAGMAFYTEEKTYISGEICVRGQESYGYSDSTISVPSNAKYARLTMFTDTETYGVFSLSGKSKIYVVTTEHTATFANEPAKIWFLNSKRPENKYWEFYNFTSASVNYGSTLTEDKTRVIYGVKSYKASRNDDANMIIALNGNANVVGVSKIKLICYIEDVTKFTSITFQIIGTSLERSAAINNLVNGWNEIEVYPHEGNVANWSTCTQIRLSINGTSGRNIWIDSILFMRRPKAPLIFIEDGGYTSFYEVAQPEFDDLNAPVTWAIDPYFIDTDTGNIPTSDMEELYKNGNVEFSFHAWGEQQTSTMTASQLINETEKTLRWLRRKGLLPKFFWRAAFWQNNAPEYMAISNIVPVLATHNSSNSLNAFPFIDPLNVPRISLHGETTASLDDKFAKMQATHCTAVFYTHGIGTGTYNTSMEIWEYFLSKLTAGINAGYIEPTTYNRLMTGDGY